MSSYIVMPAEKVAQLASDKLEAIARLRIRNEEAFIDSIVDARERHNKKLLNRLLRQQLSLDREDIRQWDLGGENPGTPIRKWRWSSIRVIRTERYEDAEDIAYNLLNASKYGDPVHVSVEELWEITR